MDGAFSSYRAMKSVPQGSVPGPLVLIFLTSDMQQDISSKKIVNADDSTISGFILSPCPKGLSC